MRLISIKNNLDQEIVINTEQICRIYLDTAGVIITTGDDVNTATQFTDIMSAVDYIQRAASVSMTERT